MSEEELQNQIIMIKGEISKLEEMSHKKELYIKNRVNEEYKPKINEIESQLNVELSKLDEVKKKIEQWSLKQKELNGNIKGLKKKIDSLEKDKKGYLATQLKAIAKEKNTNIKAVKVKIKDLEKKLKNLVVNREN